MDTRRKADKSVLARAHQPAVLAVLGPLVRSGLVATCGIVESEMLFSARNLAEHDETPTSTARLRVAHHPG